MELLDGKLAFCGMTLASLSAVALLCPPPRRRPSTLLACIPTERSFKAELVLLWACNIDCPFKTDCFISFYCEVRALNV